MNNPQTPTEAHGHNKNVTIVVNGREEIVTKDEISYEEVVALPYPNPNFAENTYKVTYFRKNDNHEGVLTKGGKDVQVTDGMVFTVIRAVRS